MKTELLIGCGSNHEKRLKCDDSMGWSSLTTLDYNADHKPDIVWDLMHPDVLPSVWENKFDEIHAYEVLEHLGQQGDYKLFFNQFTAFWRALKPNGHLLVTCPSRHSVWALGDPSHSRVLQKEMLVFLCQEAYEANVGKNSMSDFRNIYKADFNIVHVAEDQEALHFVLKAIK
jgi:2-polyprenyl-3-methyl-5-hydroxy-6-metoxy-1,4-benzoquinol methylase